MRWALLSGAKGTGKTTRLLAVVERLRARGVRVGGVVQEGVEPAGGGAPAEGRSGYVAREVDGAARLVIARLARASDDQDPEAQRVCSFAFDAHALAEARRWVARDAAECDVVVIDEVSKLELGRGGHHDAILAALAGRALTLLCVRADQLFGVMERFGLDAPAAALELGAEGEAGDLDAFVEALLKEIACA